MNTAAPIVDSFESLQAAVADFLKHARNGGCGALSDDEFVDLSRELEAVRVELTTADYPIVAEAEDRDLADRYSARNVAGFLSGLWRITPHEARARVREVEQLGPRVALTGHVLEPLRPHAARARELGILNTAQTSVVLRTLDALPRELPVEQVEAAERVLVDAAHALNPLDLRNVGLRLLDTINPDGQQPSDEHYQRRRDISFREEWDGMIRLSGLLDPATGAKAQAWFAAHSAPRPEDVTGRDDRTPGQRRHDAFAALLDLGGRASEFATATGSPATVLITMTAEQCESRTGHAATSLGQRIRVDDALRLANQSSIAWVVHNSDGGILNYGRTKRLATKAQAEALAARDGGCTTPGCLIPPEWCERHHIIEWINGGETNIENMCLLCPYHHARFLQQGWVIEMRNGVPWFIPPEHIDPDRRPLRNIRGLNAT